MDDSDEAAFARLAPLLGVAYEPAPPADAPTGRGTGWWSDARIWRWVLADLRVAESPTASDLAPVPLATIDGVVAHALERGNGGMAVAVLRQEDSWIAVSSELDDTLGTTFLWGTPRAYRSDDLDDVLTMGLTDDERELLGLDPGGHPPE
jgi:hypothetical protein